MFPIFVGQDNTGDTILNDMAFDSDGYIAVAGMTSNTDIINDVGVP